MQSAPQGFSRGTIAAWVFAQATVGFTGGGYGGLAFDAVGAVGGAQRLCEQVYLLPQVFAVGGVGDRGQQGCSPVLGAARADVVGQGEVEHGLSGFTELVQHGPDVVACRVGLY